MSGIFYLTRKQLERIRPYFPLSHGVTRVDDREVISGIIYVIKNGLMWKDTPTDYGPYKTLYNRFIRWSNLGVFNKIFSELASESEYDQRLMIDATHLKAHRTNTSDSRTLQPTMQDIKASYGLERLIVVTDKGLNSSSSIDAIVNGGDGFVFSQILRDPKGRRYAEKIFDTGGWTENETGTYRYKLFEEAATGVDKDGKSVSRKRKVLLYWSKAEADMARRKREEKLEKATRSTKNAVYSIRKGQEEYMNEDYVIKGTGEYIDHDKVKKIRSVDTEKAEADALFDAYFCIITSEIDYDERKMREVYGGLWRIEESFRMMKSDLYARPVFVRKNEHIRTHFLICSVALLILRIIQHRMGRNALSAERVASALNAATYRVFKGGIVHLDDVGGAIAFKKTINKKGEAVDTLQFSDEDEIALDYKTIQKTFNTNSYAIFQRQENFNHFLKNITLA